MRQKNGMTESQWNTSDDAIAMLEFAFDKRGIRSDTSYHRMGYRMNAGTVETDSGFYISCCRRIWSLLPDHETRNGVQVAEKWLDGNASDSELNARDYYVEGAAFGIDYKTSPDELRQWIADVDTIPEAELYAILAPQVSDRPDSYKLLKSAAYFAHYAIMYPAMNPKGMPPNSYHQFLSADLLRQHLKYDA
jgi:hypothetical protein